MQQILFPVLLALAFYALVMRPQQRRVRAHRALVEALSVGDEVVTAGGMMGTIVAAHDEFFEVQLAPQVVVSVLRGAISQKKAASTKDAPTGDAP